MHANASRTEGWVLNLILLTLSREVNVALPQTLIFRKGGILVGDPAWPVLSLYLNFYEYEMLTEEGTLLIFHCSFK